MQYQDIWEETLNQLRQTIPAPTFNVFFKNTNIGDIKQSEEFFIVTVEVPHSLAQQAFSRFAPRIEAILEGILTLPCQLQTPIKRRETEVPQSQTEQPREQTQPRTDNLAREHQPQPTDNNQVWSRNYEKEEVSPVMVKTVNSQVSILPKQNEEADSSPLFSQQTQDYVRLQNQESVIRKTIQKLGLNPEHTFENFAVSPSNEVAFAGAAAIAKDPGKTYSPFFIYGDVGVGKTHLMQAVGIRLLQQNPKLNLVYCGGEQFTNEIIEAIQMKKTPNFRNHYRKVNALLIDDIQFIAGKDFVQEEFFHTFNAIKGAGGQVIMTADKPPHEITYLEDRLRSRFEEGLSIDIQAPNFELRTAILLIKSKQMGLNLPMESAQAISQYITSTRKLEGFLKHLYAAAGIRQLQGPVNLDFVHEQLKIREKDAPSMDRRPFTRPAEIIKAIAKHFAVSEQLMYGQRRSRSVVNPRQYAMYLLRIDLKLPLQEIGRMFGGRDHTTVMHAVEKVSKEVSISETIQQEFSTIRKQIYG